MKQREGDGTNLLKWFGLRREEAEEASSNRKTEGRRWLGGLCYLIALNMNVWIIEHVKIQEIFGIATVQPTYVTNNFLRPSTIRRRPNPHSKEQVCRSQDSQDAQSS